MKNILIIIPTLKIGGGAEKSATMVGNGLTKNGHTVSYFTFYQTENNYDYVGKTYCLNEKLSYNPIIQFWKLFKRAIEIKKYCKNNSVDTVISHMEYANFSSIVSVFFGNKAKINIVVHISLIKKEILYKILIYILYRFSNNIITVSKEIKHELILKYNIKASRIYPIYNAINKLDIEEKSKIDLGKYDKILNNGKFTFINIGRLTKQKNHKILLESFDEFHKNNNNSQLIILGNGEEKKELEKQRGTLLSKNNIYFLGIQKNPYNFLFNSDCFVFSSEWEGMGIVIIEAMACGLPIISTDCPVGPKEILKKNIQNFDEVKNLSKEEYGILIPNKNIKELYEGMTYLYNNIKIRKTYSLKSTERSKMFTIKNNIKEWQKIL